jgi:hypothetical protein
MYCVSSAQTTVNYYGYLLHVRLTLLMVWYEKGLEAWFTNTDFTGFCTPRMVTLSKAGISLHPHQTADPTSCDSDKVKFSKLYNRSAYVSVRIKLLTVEYMCN